MYTKLNNNKTMMHVACSKGAFDFVNVLLNST